MQPDNSSPAAKIAQDGITRRTALKLAVAGTFGLAAGAGTTAGLAHWVRTEPAPYQFFRDAEARLLIAICEQIIPRDDTPGATDAGVIFYIDRQLASVFIRHQQTYRLGLESFRKTCLQVYAVPFEQLAFGRQTEALRLIESNQAPKECWGGRSQSGFLIWCLTIPGRVSMAVRVMVATAITSVTVCLTWPIQTSSVKTAMPPVSQFNL